MPAPLDDRKGASIDPAFEDAVSALEHGEPVIFPTDTVYGIGVSVRHCQSPRVLEEAKGRPSDKPVAWLVGDHRDLLTYGQDVPEEAIAASKDGWPGALTIVVQASASVPEAYRATDGTIGLRMPASEEALALIDAVGSPLATTSANSAGSEAPSSYDGIEPELLSKVTVALRGSDESTQGASTVIDFTSSPPQLIRDRTSKPHEQEKPW